jgi:hypothetical protein
MDGIIFQAGEIRGDCTCHVPEDSQTETKIRKIARYAIPAYKQYCAD